MGQVSIDLDQMQGVVDGLNRVLREVPPSASSLGSLLDQVLLGYPGLSRWTAGGPAIWRLSCLAQECQHRLDMARQIAAATPGSSLRVVSFDDAVFVNQDARQAADLIQAYIDNYEYGDAKSGEIPQGLLDLLEEYGDAPEFAVALADRLPAGQVAVFLSCVNAARASLQFDVNAYGTPPSALSQFDQRFNRLFDGLGGSLGLAARSMGPDRLERFTQDYQAVFVGGADSGHPGPLVLSLMIGRGSWPDSFLTGIATSILDSGVPAGSWGGLGGVQVVDPGQNPGLDGPAEVTDPMVGVYQSAATFSPWWMSVFFAGNGAAGVDLPGYEYPDGGQADPRAVQVDARVKQVMLDYGMDQDSAYWFGQAAANAAAWSLYFDSAAPPSFTGDVALMAEY